MNEAQKARLKKLQHQLTYGRGVSTSDWPELIELRRLSLIERGKNPDNWDLGSRYCKRKGA